MDSKKADNELTERKEDATDDLTLAEIEEQQKITGDNPKAPTPEPDEGSGRGSSLRTSLRRFIFAILPGTEIQLFPV